MTGRPTIKTDELINEICERVVQGRSIASIGAEEDMPDAKSIWTWLNKDESFLQKYTRAIQARAILHAERIDELAEMATRGEIPPDVARVAIDAKKWTASRLLPKLYGDKQQVEATVTPTHQLHLEALKQLAEQGRGTRSGYNAPQVIDVVSNPTFLPEMQGPQTDTTSALPDATVAMPDASVALEPPGLPPTGGAAAATAPPLSVQKKSKRKKGNGNER